jgi:hypothetical protein
VLVHFVVIGGIVDHHFLFMMFHACIQWLGVMMLNVTFRRDEGNRSMWRKPQI